MKKILILGAGRSTVSLIRYLASQAAKHDWHVTVADVDLQAAQSKIQGNSRASAVALNIENEEERVALIKQADIVISMLPAAMHGVVARDCVNWGKHMATASYVSEQMRQLDEEARHKGLLLLNECGLDPGIDHASAMKVIDEVHADGGEIVSFKSFCGGLVAPESNDNPWGYKFTWNPRNVVLAAQGAAAHYLDEGEIKYIPYNRIFLQTERISVDGYGLFDAYANRDSLSYQQPYGLKHAKTLLRGTLRMPGFCRAWNVFVKLGLTDDTYVIHQANKFTYTSLLSAYLPGTGDVKTRLINFMGMEADSEVIDRIGWLGFFDHMKVELKEGTPAQLLQHLLEKKWILRADDMDMVVMQHLFEVDVKNNPKLPSAIISSLVVKGEDPEYTAMAKTVGIPLGICVKNFLTGKFSLSGVQIPTRKEIYSPLLSEMPEHGIIFEETTRSTKQTQST